MIKIFTSKGGGKTTQLIKMAAVTKGYIVCHSLQECTRIASIARDMQADILFPISYDEFIKKEYCGKNIKGFLIDNVDMLIQYMTNVPIYAYTLSL